MNELRWILIGFGIVLLAGIYLWGRRGSTAVTEDVALRSRPEPLLQRENIAADASDEPTEDIEESGNAEATDNYETTVVRPTRPRMEARVARTESLCTAAKEAAPAADSEGSRPLSDFRRGRVEPTIGTDSSTEEISVQSTTAAATATPAPTLSSSDTPPPRRPERRKILSVRLSLSPQRVEGAKLQELLQAELLTHGKYNVFHRLHSDGQSVFSVASMVEPGTFDLEKMSETLYPGVTLFAQLPGPVPGMHALNELVACARRLQQSLGGVLQDDRGVPLTVHRIERMRQEVREFERPPPGASLLPTKS